MFKYFNYSPHDLVYIDSDIPDNYDGFCPLDRYGYYLPNGVKKSVKCSHVCDQFRYKRYYRGQDGQLKL